MDLLIKNARIVDPNGPLHGQLQDVLIQNGQIQAVGKELEASDFPQLKADGLHLSIGWMDTGVQTGDPGLEHREDFQSVGAAAAAGGFTAISCQPNTLPVVQSKSDILYVRNQALASLVNFYPMGAITHDTEGKEITEMIDMAKAGAIAFTDGHKAIQHPGIMLRALQYVKTFDGVVVNQPQEHTIAGQGQLHEGLVSTSLGMRGIPAIAESLMVQRDLQLLEYTESRLHLANISSAASVRLIREAKARGLRVTASVAIMNLCFDDSQLKSFDSNFKVSPPLRTASDREALKEGVLDGTIDIITSNHVPIEEEGKKLEFSYASFGAIGLETLYGLAGKYLSGWLSDALLIEKIAINPRKLFRIAMPKIEEGAPAELTAFIPGLSWKYEGGRIASRSSNSPVIGQELKGKVVGAFRNNLSHLQPD
jgi:dihydroorotase